MHWCVLLRIILSFVHHSSCWVLNMCTVVFWWAISRVHSVPSLISTQVSLTSLNFTVIWCHIFLLSGAIYSCLTKNIWTWLPILLLASGCSSKHHPKSRQVQFFCFCFFFSTKQRVNNPVNSRKGTLSRPAQPHGVGYTLADPERMHAR